MNPAFLAVFLVLLACSGGSGGDRKLQVGHEPDGPGGGAGLGGGAAGDGGGAGLGSGENALRVRVQDGAAMTIEILTLACAGDCADIEAVAHGGNPPYAFEWEDGSKDAKRHVCLDADQTLRVSATDTAIKDDEFSYDASTATVDVNARVLDCKDGGTSDGGSGGALCISNASFEGTPKGTVSTAAPWVSCGVPIADNSTIWDNTAYTNGWQLDPTDGKTFLVTHTNGGVGPQGASQLLCEPLLAGTTYYLRIDLASPLETVAGVPTMPSKLQLWGGNSSCMHDELLWTSPMLDPTWRSHCVTFTPTQDLEHLMLVPNTVDTSAQYGRVTADAITSVASCP